MSRDTEPLVLLMLTVEQAWLIHDTLALLPHGDPTDEVFWTLNEMLAGIPGDRERHGD